MCKLLNKYMLLLLVLVLVLLLLLLLVLVLVLVLVYGESDHHDDVGRGTGGSCRGGVFFFGG